MLNWIKKRWRGETLPEYAERPNALIGDFLQYLSGPNTAAEIKVGPERAMECVPFWAAVNFLSSSVANLPLHLYRRTADGKEMLDDPMADVLGKFWTSEITAYEGLRWVVMQACLHGVAYVRIYRDGMGNITDLMPLETRDVSVARQDHMKYYYYSPSNVEQPPEYLVAGDLLEFPWAEYDDLYCPLSPVYQCRNAIGLAIALEAYASQFFRSGGIPPLIVKREPMSEEAGKRMRKNLNMVFKKAQENRDLLVDIPDEFEVVDSKMVSPTQAQMIEARRYATEEISRVLGVPPILINDLSKGTYNNTEQQDQQFVKHTLSKFARQYESQMNLKFFGREDRERFVEFDLRAVERGLFKERIEGLATQIQNGMITPNEARATENMAASEEENADKLFMQSATVSIDTPQPDPNAGMGGESGGGPPDMGDGNGSEE